MHLSKFVSGIRKSYCTSVSLRGRSFLKPTDLTASEIKSVLWTAIEIKTLHEANKFKVKSVRDKYVFLLSQVDKIEWTSLSAAANMLDVRCDKVIKPNFENHFHDRAHFIERNVDMAFLQLKREAKITKYRNDLQKPLISIKNSILLIDLMSIQLGFGRLEGIKLAYIGECSPFINSFIDIASRLGVIVKFCCRGPSGPVTPMAIGEIKNREDVPSDQIAEVLKDDEAFQKSDVILVRPLGIDDLNDVNYIIDHAPTSCSIIDKIPSNCSYDPEKLDKKKAINTAENAKYVYAALILRFLTDYEHVTPMPEFTKRDNTEIPRTVGDNKDERIFIASAAQETLEEKSGVSKVHVKKRRNLMKKAKAATRRKIYSFRKF